MEAPENINKGPAKMKNGAKSVPQFGASRPNNRRRRHNSQSKRRLILALAVALCVSFLILLYFSVKLGMYAREITALTVSEQRLARQLEDLNPLLGTMQQEIAALTKGRLPYLKVLEFDKVISIDKEYVKNIVFTLARIKDYNQYEYKIVLDNRNLESIHPRVKVHFFDRVGIQVGYSEVGVDKDGLSTLEVLERGEIRSHSAVVQLAEDVEPAYFMVRVAK